MNIGCAELEFQLMGIQSRTDVCEGDVISVSIGSAYVFNGGIFLRQGRSKQYSRNRIGIIAEVILTSQKFLYFCFGDVTHNVAMHSSKTSSL